MSDTVVAKLYKTYAEACVAARALGIRTIEEYKCRRREDSMLPACPNIYYKDSWKGTREFLGTMPYRTLDEAMVAARGLSIKSKTEYSLRYREDPLLPAKPEKQYQSSWIGYAEFLGAACKVFYETLAEAAIAAQALGITMKTEYKSRYHEDPMLPSNPNAFYKDEWKGYREFLGVGSKYYESLAEASEAAKALGVTTLREYRRRYKEDPRLPSDPWKSYPDEWIGIPEFLGGERKNYYATLEEASAAAKSLGTISLEDYKTRHHKDSRLPTAPEVVYRHEWKGWREFLGTLRNVYETIGEASQAARILGIRSFVDYRARHNEDSRLPANPAEEYKEEWAGFSEFLGTGKDFYPSLDEAAAAARALGIQGQIEYARRYQEDPRLPANPNKFYKREWKGVRNFLGVKSYASLSDAAAAARKLGIRTKTDYRTRYKEDPLLPAKPERLYEDAWVDYSEFLAVEVIAFYETLAEASAAAIALGISGQKEYQRRYREDSRLPANPGRVYADSWKGLHDFLGVTTERYATLAEASAAVKKLGITTRAEYVARHNEDTMLPANPATEYKDDWNGYVEFIGADRRAIYKTISEAAAAAKALGIRGVKDYLSRYKEDPRLPSQPSVQYRTDWKGWGSFLETEKFYPTLAEARNAARKLGVKTSVEYLHEYRRDPRLPQKPYRYYSSEWVDFDDFLIPEKIMHYQSIHQASEAVKKLGIKSREEYADHFTLDHQLPGSPEDFYELEWHGWEDFTGYAQSTAAAIYFDTFEMARREARQLGVATRLSYLNKAAGDARFPLSPEKLYEDGWNGWRDYLGVENFQGKYNSYSEARDAVRKFGLQSNVEYKSECRILDSRLPASPERFYFDDWKGWRDYLGGNRRGFYTLEEAIGAVARLGIRGISQYKVRYREDERLPSNPHTVYAAEWKGYPHFFGRPEKVAKYESLTQASEAARALGFTTKTAYLEGYHADPMLPANPNVFYSDYWRVWGWEKFLGVDKYSYKDAGEVSRRLGISSAAEYSELQRQDIHLPAYPPSYYESDWQGWPEFLLPRKCFSLGDVKYAVKVLKIKDSRGYRQEYKKYPCLPANPDRVFADEWISWRDLCDMPELYTYEETRDLALEFGVKGSQDYKKFIADKKDPRIPRDPASAYKGRWKSWFSFLDKPEPYKIEHIPAPYHAWAESLDEFLGKTRARATKESYLCRFVRDYVQRHGLGFSPLDIYTSNRVNKGLFFEFLDGVSGAVGKSILSAVKEFSSHFMKSKLTVEDEETHETVRIAGAYDPFANLAFEGEEVSGNAGETNKPALAYQFVKAMCDWMVPDSAESFADLVHLQQFDADWIEVDPSVVDSKDPNCIVKKEYGKTKIWFPGYWMHTFAIATVPARGRQLAYNDSGEGDYEIPTVVNGKIVWAINQSPLAGITDGQGFVRKFPNDQIGMRFTSNKTSNKGEGYDIGWMPEKLAIWMIRLRDWQAKYNPIKRAMPWVECTRTDLNEKQLKAKGSNCFLFRNFGEEECGNYSFRLKFRLAAALYHSQPDGLVLATCSGALSSLSTYDTPYSPHSMRVSLITAYVMEFGLPIEIVMKIAGHGSVIMSLYYVKINSENLREKFSEGEKRALKNKSYVAMKMLEQGRVDSIKSEFIQDRDGALGRFEGKVLPGSFLFRDYGFCPFAGGRCDDGGPLIGSTKVRAPINGGYLGYQNCIRCRHFVTGPVFIGGLLALANEICLQVSVQMDKVGELNEVLSETTKALESQEDAQHDAAKAGEEFDASELANLDMKCRKLQSDIEGASKKADLYLCDLQATTRLINQSQAVLNEQVSSEDNSNLPQLIVQNEHELKVAFEDSSRFHLLSEVCENAEIYESASAEIALPMRSQKLDQLLLRNQMAPTMFALDKQQQLILGNQLTNLLLSRVKSWRKVDALIEGKLMLADLAENERVEPRDISAILGSGHGLIASDVPRALEGELL
ncbi:VPA1269 family protein [Pseudomonas sp. DP-17]|uniref:gamma-mobile-trio integrase GmtZ n=1 Tax=Pseudomonas sp. DP-17 TaxID=1580486 RepID=UPI001EFA7541|nr:VPA1269 family protein [Pseudomonas sp. DP-17]MCG8905607.1 hypothetical protein [Pseudomonas sp. DP-17]